MTAGLLLEYVEKIKAVKMAEESYKEALLRRQRQYEENVALVMKKGGMTEEEAKRFVDKPEEHLFERLDAIKDTHAPWL